MENFVEKSGEILEGTPGGIYSDIFGRIHDGTLGVIKKNELLEKISTTTILKKILNKFLGK